MKILIAIIVFSLIIIIHELGHFILAKANGVYVTEFSIGMGPRLVSVEKGETRYSIKLLPFGGSCMMLGEDEDVADDDRAFGKKSVWARISIIAAGPIFNFILAFVVSLFVVGSVGYDPAKVLSVEAGSPAAEAGLQEGDIITQIGSKGVDVSRDMEMYLQFHPLNGKEIPLSYKRDGKKYETKIAAVLKETYMLGFGYNPGNTSPIVQHIEDTYKEYPLAQAGIVDGDTITAIDGTPIKTSNELSSYFNQHPLTDQPITVTYVRGKETYEATVTPKHVSTAYTLGANVNSAYMKTNAWGVIKYSAIEVKFWIKTTLDSVGQLVRGKVSKDDIAGPVGLVDTIGNVYEQSKEYGLKSILVNVSNWLVLISANLGVMNLLPLPALDGGRLVFLFLEVIRGGKQIPKEKEGLIHMIGLVALMILMVFVMFNDITRLFK